MAKMDRKHAQLQQTVHNHLRLLTISSYLQNNNNERLESKSKHPLFTGAMTATILSKTWKCEQPHRERGNRACKHTQCKR